MEMAQVDEIVDVIQDALTANVRFTVCLFPLAILILNVQYKAWYAKSRDELLTLTQKTFPSVLVIKCIARKTPEFQMIMFRPS